MQRKSESTTSRSPQGSAGQRRKPPAHDVADESKLGTLPSGPAPEAEENPHSQDGNRTRDSKEDVPARK
ncbi:unnamed protein product [Trichogramma brassicae]|uniref:Uncharacterized protein n=1 Tax=Trichogramma brassicae TaxID=86971 RepID=A0A6H5HZ63_9HYME|nr:unnamed protein product [Trichogramma brassicae]